MSILEKIFKFKKEELKDEQLVSALNPLMKHNKWYLNFYYNRLYESYIELKKRCEKLEKERVERPKNIKKAISLVEGISFHYSFTHLFNELSPHKFKIEIVSFCGLVKNNATFDDLEYIMFDYDYFKKFKPKEYFEEYLRKHNDLSSFRNIVFVYYYNKNNERIKYLECPVSESKDFYLNEKNCKGREIEYNLCKYFANHIKENIEYELLRFKNSFDVEIVMLEDKLDNLLYYDESKFKYLIKQVERK